MQRLTTREPSLEHLAVAIAATKHALPDIFPDFDRAAYEAKEGFGTAAADTAANGDAPVTDTTAPAEANAPAADAVLPGEPGAAPSEHTGATEPEAVTGSPAPAASPHRDETL